MLYKRLDERGVPTTLLHERELCVSIGDWWKEILGVCSDICNVFSTCDGCELYVDEDCVYGLMKAVSFEEK
jgi:hypothetical protein